MTFWELISKFVKIWKQFGLHVGIKNPLRSKNIALPRGIKNWSDFYIDLYWILASFWSLVGAMFATKRPPRRPKSRPRCLQKASGRRLGARSRPRAPKRRPDPLQDSILDPSRPRFETILEASFDNFRHMFKPNF